jgi:hypothetical protein
VEASYTCTGLTVSTGRIPISRRQRILGGLLGLAVLVGVVLLNELAFRTWLNTDYLRWYLDNGAVIGFVFTLVTLACGDINRDRLLISANPIEYGASSLTLLTAPWSSLAAMIEPDRKAWQAQRELEQAHHQLGQAQRQFEESLPELRRVVQQLVANAPHDEARRRAAEAIAQIPASKPSDSEDTPAETEIVPTGLPVVDILLAMLFALAFWLATLGWLLLIAPVQYFVYLATGAPARVACASPARTWVKSEEKHTIISEALKSNAMLKGAIESGFTAKPVSFTAAITTAVLFAVSQSI